MWRGDNVLTWFLVLPPLQSAERRCAAWQTAIFTVQTDTEWRLIKVMWHNSTACEDCLLIIRLVGQDSKWWESLYWRLWGNKVLIPLQQRFLNQRHREIVRRTYTCMLPYLFSHLFLFVLLKGQFTPKCKFCHYLLPLRTCNVRKIFRRISVTKQISTPIYCHNIYFSYYGSKRVMRSVWVLTHFQISSFAFSRTKKVTQVLRGRKSQ